MGPLRLGALLLLPLGSVWALGQALARRRTAGDAASDDFELAAYFGGAQRASTAASLRRGVVRAWRVLVEHRSTLGGVDARVTPPEELPARLGGAAIGARDPE